MTFWNGSDWVPETSPTPSRGRPSRAAAWVATFIMIASLVFYVVPFASITASGPTMTLSPTSGAPGTRVTVTGNGFSPKSQIQLSWDGASGGMPTASSNPRGGFRVTFKVPQSPVGKHTSSVRLVPGTTRRSTQVATQTASASSDPSLTTDPTLARAVFDVTAAASATPIATVTPTAQPTPRPNPTAAPPTAAPPTAAPPTAAPPTAAPPTAAPPTAAPPTAAPPTAAPPTAAPPTAAPPTAVPPAPPAGAKTVPATINATCATDVSPLLNAWIAAQPNGSTLIFPAGSCYKLQGDAGLNLANRSGLTLVGTGSTIQLRTSGASNFSSAFFLQQSDHITIRGFAVDGGNTATGTTGAGLAVNEKLNAANVRGGTSFIEFDHVSWDRLYGFGVIIGAEAGTIWPSDIYVHDSIIRGGEMGVAVTAGRRVRIEHNTINNSVYSAIDLEPDASQAGGGGFQDVLINDNDVAGYSWGQTLTSWFLSACPQDAVVGVAIMDRLTVTGNRVHVGAATADNGNADGLGGLGIRSDKANLKRDFVVTNNWTVDNDTRSSTRFVLNLANVQNLTVTGNRQPISNGSGFLIDANTTGTRVVGGNDTTP